MSILILITQQIFLVGLVSHLWYYTDFFPVYLKLFSALLPKSVYTFLLIEEYLNRGEQDLEFGYIEYVSTKYYFTQNKILSFLLKLLSCPICFGVWLSVFSSLVCGNIFYLGVIFFFSRLVSVLLKFFLKLQ